MADILLTTLNAKYIHTAFGLRYLMANLGPLQSTTQILEFDINQRPLEVAEKLLARDPKIIGVGVYIWNLNPVTELVGLLKRLRPDLVIILGGPEVSYDSAAEPVVGLADYVITGEADFKFAEVCDSILCGRRPGTKVIVADLPEVSRLALPYGLYTETDIAQRIVYVEASRGCPFRCEFCLSSLDIPVRQFPLDEFLDQIGALLDRGARHLKFVDRTFNLNIQASRSILEFLLDRFQPGHFFHFEMVPDRLPEELREVICRFPPGALQLEVGIQTFNPDVGERIQRRQNYERLEENLRFLRTETGVHLHADLIVGLPGETLDSFAAGFDRLVGLGPQEIQVGILKRLKGTPISRHDQDWNMVYAGQPPYEILQSQLLDFKTLQRLRRFSRYWDLVSNSGNFVETTPWLWSNRNDGSPFHGFLAWSDWLYDQVGRTDSIALPRLVELVFQYLTGERNLDPVQTARLLWADYIRGGRREKLPCLRDYLPEAPAPLVPGPGPLPKRQARRLR